MLEGPLKLVLRLDTTAPAESQPVRLNALFARLADTPLGQDASEVEDLIWTVWTGHSDAGAAAAMERAISAMAERRLDDAEALLDELVAREPTWSEAWNKRATLYYLQQRDAESIGDILRTLELEPRHFGALSGLAQIALRQGDHTAALVALETALRINPHLASARAAVEQLRARQPRSVH